MSQSATNHEHTHSCMNDKDDFFFTTLTNPGIIDRLEQDIADYLARFGFSLRRQVRVHEKQGRSGCGYQHAECQAVLTVPRLPYTGISPANSSLTQDSDPIGILHLNVHDTSLLATVGPLLRTFLRLSPTDVHPMRLRAMINCDFTIDALENIDKMSSEQKLDHWNRQEELNAKRMTHHLHLLIRNSMGSALCMDLVIRLPNFWRRTLTHDNKDLLIIKRGSLSHAKIQTRLSIDSMKRAMRDNPDAYYPNVQLIERFNENGTATHTSFNNESSPVTSLHLDVRTRMCTVRHQSLLFRWISSWENPQVIYDCKSVMLHPGQSRMERMPLIVACIEKVGNLHRILMLLHDYDKKNRNITGTNDPLFPTELVIIMPTNSNTTQLKNRQNFEEAVDNYFEKHVSHSEDGIIREKRSKKIIIIEEDDAVGTIFAMATQRQSMNAHLRIIGIDLHPHALTLHGNYAPATSLSSPALQTIRNADAIIFGYESTGIPSHISNELLCSWIQIPSRSSINVVAAISIVLDAL